MSEDLDTQWKERGMTYEHLIVETRGDALWVTMNRPERLNALNRRLVEELRDLFVGLYWRHEVRVVVLRGAGRGFCAGLDLKGAAKTVVAGWRRA